MPVLQGCTAASEESVLLKQVKGHQEEFSLYNIQM